MEGLDGFRQRLQGRFPHFTKSQRRIVTYILGHYDEAAFLPAVDLARRLGVSEATVVRCARAMGFDGFPDLRRSLQDLFRSRATPATRLRHKLDDLRNGHVLLKMADMELRFLSEVPHSIRTADFDRAVQFLVAARRIFAFGLGPARILPDLLEIRLRRFGVPVMSLTESGRDVLEKLLLLGPDDVVIAAAFLRVTPELVSVLDHARGVGCPTVLITDTLGIALKDDADVILAARRGPISTFHSLTVPMTIVNALILAVAMTRPKEMVASLDRLQKMRTASGLDMMAKDRDRNRRR